MGVQKMWSHICGWSIYTIHEARTNITQDTGPELISFYLTLYLYQAMNNEPVVATIKIGLDEALLKIVNTALNLETKTPSSERSETSIYIEAGLLVIQTKAADTSALRAALNSYLRWVEEIQNIVASIK